MGDETVTGKEEREIPKCPSCGSRKVVRIVYGMPGPELVEAYERGEVQLGGQCVLCRRAGDRVPRFEGAVVGHGNVAHDRVPGLHVAECDQGGVRRGADIPRVPDEDLVGD